MGDDQDIELVIGGLISSPDSDYEVQDVLGSGSFGLVAQCQKLATNTTVALKVIKSESCIEQAKDEVCILDMMKRSGSDMFNIITCNDSFTYEGHYCLEFEKLDINLHEFLHSGQRQGLQLREIRPIVQQLSEALQFLKRVGVTHGDLKPENVMMVDCVQQPLRVRVIDFGLACTNTEKWTGAVLQTLWYRSPEVLLGASFNEAIDVWSLGCIAAELLMGTALFPASDEYDMMRHIVYTVGKPPDRLLEAGQYTEEFFHERFLEPRQWRFMTMTEAKNFNCHRRTISSLNELRMVSHGRSGEDADGCERASFVDLLRQLLAVDACKRITPSHILQHSFMTTGCLAQLSGNERPPLRSPSSERKTDQQKKEREKLRTTQSVATATQKKRPRPARPRSATPQRGGGGTMGRLQAVTKPPQGGRGGGGGGEAGGGRGGGREVVGGGGDEGERCDQKIILTSQTQCREN